MSYFQKEGRDKIKILEQANRKNKQKEKRERLIRPRKKKTWQRYAISQQQREFKMTERGNQIVLLQTNMILIGLRKVFDVTQNKSLNNYVSLSVLH